MSQAQPGILADVPPLARYMTFQLLPEADPRPALEALAAQSWGDELVVGIGSSAVYACEADIDGLRALPAHDGPGFSVPSTPTALWCWLRGTDRGELLHAGREIELALAGSFEIDAVVDGFRYGSGRDLTGYEDGTENPTGEDALEAAFAAGRGAGLDGSSFVAVQLWQHDLDGFESMSPAEQDLVIGRRRSDNEEIEDAPPWSHVKRTAQEEFEPPAFVLRRSMPWADGDGEGLVFVAFGRSLDAFEALLNRMVGGDDGITDALFRFSRPLFGASFWCPPIVDGRLDLRQLGIDRP